MTGPVLRGALGANGHLLIDGERKRSRESVTIRLRDDGATFSLEGSGKARKVDIGGVDTTERLGPLRIWMKGDGRHRALFIRDANGQTVELPLQPLRAFLSAREEHVTRSVHHKLHDLGRVVAQLRDGADAAEDATLAVMVPDASIPAQAIAAPRTPLGHTQRAANVATLAQLLSGQDVSRGEVERAYDAMVMSAAQAVIGGRPVHATRTTLATVPRTAEFMLGLSGYDGEYLACYCDVVCTLEGDTVRLQSRLGMDETHTLRRDGDAVHVKTAAGESSLDAVLRDAFGFALPATAARLLGALEVGGEAYRGPDGEVSVFRNGQAAAVIYDDGVVGAMLSNQHAHRVPKRHDLLFGYHSHPQPDAKILPMAAGTNPAKASSGDLMAFAQASDDNKRPIPQLIWYRSGNDEMTGLIFVPTKGKHGYEAPAKPTKTIRVTVAKKDLAQC